MDTLSTLPTNFSVRCHPPFFFHQEFGEAGTMLSATCDEFLKNLCDCVELAEGNFGELKCQALTVN